MESSKLINVVAQQFYGNRTGSEIRTDKINYFLKGILSPELFPGEDQTVNRRIVRIPNDEHIVIVYDQNQEDEYHHESCTCEICPMCGELIMLCDCETDFVI